MTVEWRGKPVWIINRTKEMLDTLPKLADAVADPKSEKTSQQPAYAQNDTRSIKPEIMVVVGICTHLLFAVLQVQGRYRRRHAGRLAGRFPLPLPRFDLRLRWSRVQGKACPDQP